MTSFPRIVIGAPSSSSGKTTFTCGLLRAFVSRGLKVSAFKCGPDFIDPLFHRHVLKVPSRNIDLFLSDEDAALNSFCRTAHGSDVSVVEGVMGYYDGLGGSTLTASTYDVTRTLQAPALLVMDASGTSLTAGAVVKGIAHFVQDSCVEGVVFNRCTARSYPLLADAVRNHTDVRPLGYVPFDKDVELPSRHLGLYTAHEIVDLEARVERMRGLVEDFVDVDEVLRIARSAPDLPHVISSHVARDTHDNRTADAYSSRPDAPSDRPVLAVARDDAFCFYYDDNFDVFRDAGFDIAEFSPLHDSALPAHTSALYLGGGYPELFCAQLSDNRTLRAHIADAHAHGMPVLGECGGYLYLLESLADKDGRSWPMVGFVPGNGHLETRLGNFGYVEVEARRSEGLLPLSSGVRAHEFHYCVDDGQNSDLVMTKPVTGKQWTGGVNTPRLLASFAHLYLPSCPHIVRNMYDAAIAFSHTRRSCI